MNIRKSLPAGFPYSRTFLFSNLHKAIIAMPHLSIIIFSYLNLMINLNKASQKIGNIPSKTNNEYKLEIQNAEFN